MEAEQQQQQQTQNQVRQRQKVKRLRCTGDKKGTILFIKKIPHHLYTDEDEQQASQPGSQPASYRYTIMRAIIMIIIIAATTIIAQHLWQITTKTDCRLKP